MIDLTTNDKVRLDKWLWVAQALYAETPESIAQREKAATQARHAAEPSLTIAQGRPTKRNRRDLADWNRWSASVEPD